MLHECTLLKCVLGRINNSKNNSHAIIHKNDCTYARGGLRFMWPSHCGLHDLLCFTNCIMF
jgi:hypothetical protein